MISQSNHLRVRIPERRVMGSATALPIGNKNSRLRLSAFKREEPSHHGCQTHFARDFTDCISAYSNCTTFASWQMEDC